MPGALLSDEPDSERALELAIALAAEDPSAGHAALCDLADAAAATGRQTLYLFARYNQGAVERDAGRQDLAIATWSEALEHDLDMADESQRFARSLLEFNCANTLRDHAADALGAIELYDALINREGWATLPGTRDRVARAAINRVIACLEAESEPRAHAALADLAALAERWDDDELRRTAADMARDLGRQAEIATPWTSSLEGDDPSHVAAAAEHKDALHLAAIERLARADRTGEPFVLLLRSFGRISVETGSIHGIPMVSATLPGVSVGHPLEAELVGWLEARALVVAVAQPDAVLMDERDAFPRIALVRDWYAFVQRLILSAEGIVVMATGVSDGLVAETRAIEWLARADDTVLITAPGVDPDAFGSFPYRLTWGGGERALDSDLYLRTMLARLERISARPLGERLAAIDVAHRTRTAAAIAHQQLAQPPPQV